jgi:hypothetical protein
MVDKQTFGMGLGVFFAGLIIGLLLTYFLLCPTCKTCDCSTDCSGSCTSDCCASKHPCGGAGGPAILPIPENPENPSPSPGPNPSWTMAYQGIGSTSSNPEERGQQETWGHQTNITPGVNDTLEKAQAWVKSQGGVALTYPASVCTKDPCESPWYFFWATQPFVGLGQPNEGWTAYNLE